MIPRLFVPAPLAKAGRVRLAPAQVHYLTRVLRLQAGAAVVLFDGTGGEWQARWDGNETAELVAFRNETREARLRLVLAQALVAREKLELIVQKATELGAADIVLFPAQRSIARLAPQRRAHRLARLRAIAIEAAEQSGRTRIPRLALAALAALTPQDLGIFLHPQAEHSWPSLQPRLASATSVVLVVGPEGGLCEEECAQLRAQGFVGVRMGARVLRTETAGLAALAAVLATHPKGWQAEP